MADLDTILAEFKELKDMIKNNQPGITSPPPEIIDTKELCIRLAISEPTAIKMRKRKMPYFKLGNSVRYNWPTIIQFLESKNKKAS